MLHLYTKIAVMTTFEQDQSFKNWITTNEFFLYQLWTIHPSTEQTHHPKDDVWTTWQISWIPSGCQREKCFTRLSTCRFKQSRMATRALNCGYHLHSKEKSTIYWNSQLKPNLGVGQQLQRDCSNLHHQWGHLDRKLAPWQKMGGDYEITGTPGTHWSGIKILINY